MEIKRGDIFLVDCEPVKGSEQGGVRPCLIIQNDLGNKYSPLTIIAPITSKKFTKNYLTNVFLKKEDAGLDKESTIMLNQIRTIDKKRIVKKIGKLNSFIMEEVNNALKISLDLS